MNVPITAYSSPLIALLALLLWAGSAGAGGEADLTALKLDVLCRGGHHGEKLAAHRHWCDGYARALRDAMKTNDTMPAHCVPGKNKALWDRFGAWLVATPENRNMPATEAVLASLRVGCP